MTTTRAKTTTGKMKGGVRQRGGTWTFTLYLGPQPAQRCTRDGCRHREWIAGQRLEACPKCGGELREKAEPRQFAKGGYPTREAAVDALAQFRVDYKGSGSAPELLKPITLATFLRDEWLPKAVDPSGRRKQTTRECLHRHVERHLIGPASQPFPLGLTELRKLTREQIAAHYSRLREGYLIDDVLRTKFGRPIRDRKTGRPKPALVTRRGLSENSVRRVHAALHSALAWAVERKYLASNPATGAANDLGDADAPERELPAWSEADLAAFLTSQADSELWPLWHVLAYTGMRRGEALGLQWRDVDLEAGELTVRQTRIPVKGDGHGKPGRFIISSPKTKRPRTVELDTHTVEVLRSVMMRSVSPEDLTDDPPAQADTGSRWVFADSDGEPLNSNSVSYRFRKAVAGSKQRAIPLHGLRHTHATFLLSRGVPIHVVSARLGHADTAMTLRVYAWCLPKAQQAAVQVLEQLGVGSAQ